MSSYADNEYLFTSESVTEGHPDKVADQISDGVLDAVLARRPVRAAWPARRWSTPASSWSPVRSRRPTYVDIQEIARETIREIGYTDADSASTRHLRGPHAIDKQSPDIAQGVDHAYETATRLPTTSSTSPAPATRA